MNKTRANKRIILNLDFMTKGMDSIYEKNNGYVSYDMHIRRLKCLRKQ